MHGHSYRLEVAIRGPLQTQGPASGMVEDFETIEGIVEQRVIGRLDHQTLNDIVENPTAENVLLWIWQQLDGHLRGFEEAVLWETPRACAVLKRSDVHTSSS
jgi:6-pyruvoyltetrahydropterin/6-carboxytetrahydropterin synthase